MAGIIGNQTSRAENATTEHNSAVTSWQQWGLTRLLIGLTALVIGSIVTLTGLDFWWTLLLGIGLFWGGGKLAAASKKSALKEAIWVWPQVMRYTGAAILLIGVFLNSGFGLAVKNAVSGTEAAIACSAGEKSARCDQWRAEQAAQKAAEQEARLREAERQATIIAARTPQPIKAGLGPEAYLAKITGVFTPIKIEDGTFIGPIGNFTGTCLIFTVVDGNKSHFQLWSRPDTTSAPVQAVTKGARVVKLGHDGPTAHEFYAAKGGDVTIALERKRSSGACS